jgi:hypothetical protein
MVLEPTGVVVIVVVVVVESYADINKVARPTSSQKMNNHPSYPQHPPTSHHPACKSSGFYQGTQLYFMHSHIKFQLINYMEEMNT